LQDIWKAGKPKVNWTVSSQYRIRWSNITEEGPTATDCTCTSLTVHITNTTYKLWLAASAKDQEMQISKLDNKLQLALACTQSTNTANKYSASVETIE